MGKKLASSLLALSLGLFSVVGPKASYAAGVVGTGTAASCTEAALDTALAGGGNVTFNCGGAPLTITITSSKTINANTTLDGGGLISISGGNVYPYISVNTGRTFALSNITLRDASPGTPYNVGSTLSTSGTTTLTNVKFINNNRKAVFNQSGSLTVDASLFDGNTSSSSGAAIDSESDGTLLVRDSLFNNNRAGSVDSQSGGAIYNGGNVTTQTRATIIRSTFTANKAGTGGAIQNFGTMSITDSTFTANQAPQGGAITANTPGSLEIVNSTISENTAGSNTGSPGSSRGGGIQVAGSTPGNAATLRNVTLAKNNAPASSPNNGGGNIAVLGNATLTLVNTIIANPGGSSVNCLTETTGSGTLIDGGNNLQYPATTCLAITTADPKLSALADNGGFTKTHAIAADSPARNAANNQPCPSFDQRGVMRPQNGTCDIGAFEYGAVPAIASVNAACAPASGAALPIVITGSNFIPGPNGSKISVNGTPIATTFISATQLNGVIPAAQGAPAGSAVTITVTTPTVDGGTATRQLSVCFTVYLPHVMN